MHRFSYHEPNSTEEAVALLSGLNDAKVLAGGTDLLVGMRKGVCMPANIVNIKKIRELSVVKKDSQTIEIGAAVTMFETEKVLEGRLEYQAFAQAIHSVASCQIRNRATVAGNLCNASPAADTATALVALGANVRILGSDGERILPVENLFIAPRCSALANDEVLTAVLLPSLPGIRSTFLKKSRRPSVDLATVNVAAAWDGKAIRIALGAVAPTVIRAAQAEKYINQHGLCRDTAIEAAKLAQQSAKPISDLRGSKEYRLELVRVLTEQALTALAGGEAQ